MRVNDLAVSGSIIKALNEQGFDELYPPQAAALPKALAGKNLVVSSPTASGKTLIAYITALKAIIESGKKVLYIVPLKALASEKKDDMDKFSHLKIKTAISIGDLDSEDKWLENADFIVATSEKADSLIRHGSNVVENLGLIIADEIHLIHDPLRGPTIEVALTKLKRRCKNAQIIALSATISNAGDIAMWLDADLIEMNWRSIPLYEGVYYNREITFDDGHIVDIPEEKDDIWGIVKQTVQDGGQCIIFVNTRRSTESLAVKYSSNMKTLTGKNMLDDEMILVECDADATALGKKLAICIKCGIAFHNAGLTSKQRRYVENNFRNGNIKCIVATPTLAAGINLPARRVIVRDTRRFESNSGYTPISVMEIKQMCGRAGRPGYDPYGESVLIAKSDEDCENLMDNCIKCCTESVMSKLGNESVLKNHVLSLIATGDASSIDDIINFIRDTFYGSESELYGIKGAIENIVEFLAKEEMIEVFEKKIHVLPFGKRVSDLYIDPMSAVILKEALQKMTQKTEEFPILVAVAMTPDVTGMYPRKRDEDMLLTLYQEWIDKYLVDPPNEYDYDFEYFIADMKTAALIKEWISEIDEDSITESFGIGPGDIRSRVDMMDWILYAMSEIAVLLSRLECVKTLRDLLIRVRYGVKKELINLIRLKGVGRVKARILFNNRIQKIDDIINIEYDALASIPGIGNSLAKSLKEQVENFSKEWISGRYVPTSVDESDTVSTPKQSKISDFKYR